MVPLQGEVKSVPRVAAICGFGIFVLSGLGSCECSVYGLVGSDCMVLLRHYGKMFPDYAPWAWPRYSRTPYSMKLTHSDLRSEHFFPFRTTQ